MRKMKIYRLFFLFLMSFLLISADQSYAFLLPPGPATPTIDGPTDVTHFLKNVGSAATNVASQAGAYMQEQVKIVKAAKKKYMDKFTGFMGGIFKKKKKKAIPGSKTIQESKIADIYDPESVKKALYTLFLGYPTTKEKYMACYRGKAEEFYQDTVIEVYTSVRQLELELKNLEESVDALTQTLVAGDGGSGAESNSDANGVWKNYYTAFETMDELLQITEELTAMKAQYEAAKVMKDSISPAAKNEKKNDKNSSLLDGKIRNTDIVTASAEIVNCPAVYRRNAVLAMAQIGDVVVKSTSKAELSQEQLRRNFEANLGLEDYDSPSITRLSDNDDDEEDDEDYVYEPSGNGLIDFVEAPASSLKSPFEGSEDKIAELEKVTPVYEKALSAMEVHNLMQSLPAYRETFERYEQFVKLHEKSLEALRASDKCAVGYLSRYYNNPQKVWAGDGITDELVNEYDLRTGISGWAVKSYEVAKAEETSPISSDDLNEIEIDASIDSSDLSNMDAQTENIKAQTDGIGLANPSQQQELENATRETGLLNWNIGAEASTLLAEDQYSASPKWGKPDKKFPVWNDQKTFYNQYLGGKYDNIKEYLQNVDVNDIALQLAYKLNDMEDSDRRNSNAKELGKLSALLEKKKSETDGASSLQGIIDARNQALEEAKKLRSQKLASLESRKAALNASRDKASELVKIYNERINQLSQESLEAGSEKKRMLEFVGELEDRQGDTEDNIVTYTDRETETYEQELVPETEKEIVKTTQTMKKSVSTVKKAVAAKTPDTSASSIPASQTVTTAGKKMVVKDVLKEKQIAVYPEDDEDAYSEFDELVAPVQPKRQQFKAPAVLEKQSFYRHSQVMALAQIRNVDAVQSRRQAFGSSSNLKSVLSKASEKVSDAPAEAAGTVVEEQTAATPAVVTHTKVLQAITPQMKTVKYKARETTFEDTPVQKVVETGVSHAAPQAKAEYISEQKIEYTPEMVEDVSIEKIDAQKATYTRTIETVRTLVSEENEQISDAKASISESEKAAVEAEQNAEALRDKIKTQKAEIERLTKQIEAVDEDIAKIDQAYNVQIQLIESNYKASMDAEKAKIEQGQSENQVTSLLELYNNELKPKIPTGTLGQVIKFPVLDLLSQTDALVGDTRDYAAEAVEKAKNDMMKLGDDLYLSSSNKIVVKRHAELIEELKKIPLQELSKASTAVAALSGKPDIANLLSTLYQQILLEKACANDNCKKIDDEFFVGAMGKERDFRAPKAAPDIHLPPFREVVHFDEVDYTNIPQLADGSITKEGFLNNGAKIPEIWKLMLKPQAYVEKDIDLSSALHLGGEKQALFRAGRYPCRLDGHVIDVSAEDGMYLIYDNNEDNMPACQDLALKKNSPLGGLAGIKDILNGKYYTVTDLTEDVKGPAAAAKGKPAEINPSELGVLVASHNFNLTFSAGASEIFSRLKQMESELAQNTDYEKNLKDEAYMRAILKDNQIGNFLDFVETEKAYRQTKEELAVSIEEAKKDLFAQFEKAGFKPSADFNLARAEDYALAVNQLDRLKNKQVNEAYSDMGKIDIVDNEVVEERVEKLKTMLGALRKDKDELISLNEVTPADAELDEQIKIEEVNRKVSDEYAKKANEELNKQLNTFIRPYCAAY